MGCHNVNREQKDRTSLHSYSKKRNKYVFTVTGSSYTLRDTEKKFNKQKNKRKMSTMRVHTTFPCVQENMDTKGVRFFVVRSRT